MVQDILDVAIIMVNLILKNSKIWDKQTEIFIGLFVLGKVGKLLVEQIYSTVRWRESILKMSKDNVTDFIEIGPGKVLSGLIKRTNDKVLTRSINKIEDLKMPIQNFVLK